MGIYIRFLANLIRQRRRKISIRRKNFRSAGIFGRFWLDLYDESIKRQDDIYIYIYIPTEPESQSAGMKEDRVKGKKENGFQYPVKGIAKIRILARFTSMVIICEESLVQGRQG